MLLTFAVEGQDKNKKGLRFFWSDLAPFAIVLLIEKHHSTFQLLSPFEVSETGQLKSDKVASHLMS